MQPAAAEIEEPVVAPEPEVESVEEDGPGWLVESEESAGPDYRDKWMAPTYASLYPRLPPAQLPPPVKGIGSSQPSFEFAVVPDLVRPSPSHVTRAPISSGSDSSGDSDDHSLQMSRVD